MAQACFFHLVQVWSPLEPREQGKGDPVISSRKGSFGAFIHLEADASRTRKQPINSEAPTLLRGLPTVCSSCFARGAAISMPSLRLWWSSLVWWILLAQHARARPAETRCGTIPARRRREVNHLLTSRPVARKVRSKGSASIACSWQSERAPSSPANVRPSARRLNARPSPAGGWLPLVSGIWILVHPAAQVITSAAKRGCLPIAPCSSA